MSSVGGGGGAPSWMPTYPNYASLPVPPPPGTGSVAIVETPGAPDVMYEFDADTMTWIVMATAGGMPAAPHAPTHSHLAGDPVTVENLQTAAAAGNVLTSGAVGALAMLPRAGIDTNATTHAGRTDNPHAVTAAQTGADPAGTAAAAVGAHVGAADPHTQYQKESEKGFANGYAELDGSGKVPLTQLPPLDPDYAGRFEAATITTGDVPDTKWSWWWNTSTSKMYIVRNRSGSLYAVEAAPLP